MSDEGKYIKTRQLVKSVATTMAVESLVQGFLDAEYISHMLAVW